MQKLIGLDGAGNPYFPVPYDFDASGFVDAHYALPPVKMGVRRITDRRYRGFCINNDKLAATLDLFREKKPALMGILEGEDRLAGKSCETSTRLPGRLLYDD